MRLKKILLGMVAGGAITTGAALVPAKEAAAEGGFNCVATKPASADCGCPTCDIKNCTCSIHGPAPEPPYEGQGGGDSTAN
jgi:hypothetical protein